MALGEICCTIDISKTWRSSKIGFLFFLVLQMSLLSKVWTSTTAAPEDTSPTDVASTSVSGPTSQTHSVDTASMSSAVSSDQTATSASSVTAASSTHTQSTASSSATVASTVSAHTLSSENHTALSCPTFACINDCYEQFMNTTAKPCLYSEDVCKIMKRDPGYSVSCSASCGQSCGNLTLTNCSVDCCNTTNCLNNTLLTLSNSVSTTVATTKPTTTSTTTKAIIPTTQVNNGKKCHNGNCNGAACYKAFSNTVKMCPLGQDYCMLQKTSGSTESWQAGCSADCRKMTACSSTTTTACHLECCNATTSGSCLKLTGEVNMPSSASRGPHCPALLTASLLLFWILKVFT